MNKCPTCQRSVSSRAKYCPSCGEDFAALNEEQTEINALVIKLLLIGLVVAGVGLVILFPGYAINWAMGRLKDEPDLLWASIKDWST
jgi:hypothetical protein